MPLYEYRCRGCGEVTEVLQKVSDPPLTKCGTCSGALEKLISRTSFQLKGGGWYAHGYGGSKGSKGGGDSSSGSGGGADSSSSSAGSGSSADSTSTPKSEKKKESKPGSSDGDSRAAAQG